MSNAAPCLSFRILIQETGRSFVCQEGERLLPAMERYGRSDIPVGCRGGGCGVCKVRVTSGRYRTGRMSRKHISSEDAVRGVALACQIYPNDDLVVSLDRG